MSSLELELVRSVCDGFAAELDYLAEDVIDHFWRRLSGFEPPVQILDGRESIRCRGRSIRKADERFRWADRAVDAQEYIAKLSAARRKRIECIAEDMKAEELTLGELRKARKLTQVKMAKKLGVTQDSVSRLEKRSDLLLSTLRKTVEAMGGKLSLVAEFPDRPPVVVAGSPPTSPNAAPSSRACSCYAHTGHHPREPDTRGPLPAATACGYPPWRTSDRPPPRRVRRSHA